MTSLCGRIALRTVCRNVQYTPIRYSKKMNDPLDHATGIEKRELCARQDGNKDPFNTKVLKRGPGTKDKPNKIPSAFEARLVGCICNDESVFPLWMWLYKGQPKRCECGYWFVLVETPPL